MEGSARKTPITHETIIAAVDAWKPALLRQALWIILAGAIFAVTLWTKRVGRLNTGNILGIAFISLVSVALHPRIGWRPKTWILILCLNMSGLAFPFLVGVRFTALSLALAAILVAATFFGRQTAYVLLGLNTLFIGASGFFFGYGGIELPLPLLEGESPERLWIKTAGFFFVISLLLTRMITALLVSLEKGAIELAMASKKAQQNETRYRRLFDHAPDAIVVMDASTGRFIDVNHRAELLSGYTLEEMQNLTPDAISPPTQENGQPSGPLALAYINKALQGEVPVFEWTHINRDGEKIPCEVRLLRIPADNGYHVRGSITDIRERKRQQAIIQSLALYDNLTGLPNRKLFNDRIHQAIAISARDKHYGAVLFVDIDNFKNINDSSGHAGGDFFLTVVAERITGSVAMTDTVARWGGDEFVVILEELGTSIRSAAQKAEEVGEKILQSIQEPISNPLEEGQFFANSVSIGITLFYGHINTPDELVKRADIAMYQAKAAGKNQLRNFDMEMQKQVEERLAIENHLKVALERDEFELVFQPQYDAARQIFGAEILLRWRHPERGMVLPASFISVAEETGDIVPIGKWIIKVACGLLNVWRTDPRKRHLILSINVSSRQFREPTFMQFLQSTVKGTGVDPSRIKLELTESLMLDDILDVTAKMQSLREMGLGFSLDDFGTGYSSLSYLKQLPLSQLKIDQSFVRDITTDRNDAVLIRTIIGMAENLNLQVLAEGVETDAQFNALLEMGCHAYQGYYFSKPISIEAFERLLTTE
jgi:diguanylate cyclase (GGDEF)-like protein/PAS domain S-box-containing protein